MRRTYSLLTLALVLVVAGVACNTKSPTAPPASPTPSAYSISLTPSASSVEVGNAILITARVTTGSTNVPDGTSVTFRLTGCQAGGASDPSFENGACEIARTTSAGVATATVFSKSASGTYEVVAIVPNAQVKLNVRFFNPVNPRTLAIYSLVPNQGDYRGGEQVTIQGRGFQAPVTVDFVVNGTTRHAAVTSVSADGSSVAIVTPTTAFVQGTSSVAADVTVTSAAGTSNQVQDTFAQGFSFLFPQGSTDPQIYSIVPSQGLVTGGDQVIIFGANFLKPVTVTFGAENVQVVSISTDSSQVTLKTPKHSGVITQPLQVDVTVTNSAGKAVTRANGFTWLPTTATPVIYQVSPNRGTPRGGETIQITGANLCGSVDTSGNCLSAPTVTFNPASGYGIRSATVSGYGLDGKSLQVVTPQLSPDPVVTDVSVTVTVSNPQGSASLPNGFTYVGESRPPIIYYLQPDRGTARGGDDVTIFGRYFLKPVRVTFSAGNGDAQVVSVADDGTSVSIKTPPSTLQPLPADTTSGVTVITQAGTGRDQSATIAQGFLYLAESPTPQIYSLSPNAGPLEGGTRVTITGTGFQTPVQVLFNDRQAQVVSSNYNTIVCLSPSITATGPATPTTYNVSVINVNTGKTSNSLPFRYGDSMFISSIAPSQGSDAGGTVVTIFGQGFVAPVAVTLAGVGAQILSVSGTEIVVRSVGVLHRSCGDTTGPTVVTNIDSTVSATGPTWTYVAALPLITSVTVSGGSLGGTSNLIPEPGTACTDVSYNHTPGWASYTGTINGINFEAGMRAVFTTPAIEVPTTFVSSTRVTFTIPDLSALVLTKAACTLPDGSTQGQRNVPTSLDLGIKNAVTGCSDTLKGALVIQPCAVDCQGALPPLTMTLTPVTASIAGGTSLTYAVNLSRPASAAGNITVVISASGAGVIASPTTLSVPIAAGQQTVTFNVTAGANPGTATLIATFAGASATATLTVTTAVNGIIFAPGSITLSPGASATFGISINPPAAVPTTVTVNLIGPAGVVTAPVFPQTVVVPPGGSGTLAVTAGPTGGTVTLQGTSGGLTPGSATVTVIAPAVVLSLTPATQTLAPTQTAALSVSITPPPAAPATVTLTLAGPSGILSAPVFPTTVTVPITGTASLAITAGATTGTVTINASYGTATASAQVTVATTPLVLSLAPTSQTLAVGATANFIASINTAQPVPVDVFITQNGPTGVISFTGLTPGPPPFVTIPAGQSFTNFTVNGLTVGGPVTVTGTLPPAYGGGTANSSVTVTNFTLSLAPNPLTLAVGANSNMTLTLNLPAPATTVVNLVSANPAVAAVPASVTIAGGATSATFVVTGAGQGTTTITAGPVATLGNAQATATVTVTNFTLTLAPNPVNLGVGATANMTVTLNSPAPATTAINLASANVAVATVPATVTIAGGATSATFVVTGAGQGTTTITAGPVVSLGNAQATATVTVTNFTLTLSPNPLTLAPSATANMTVTLNNPAPATTVVTLTSASPAIASVPASVTIAGGATSATFVVTAVGPGTTTVTAGPVASLGNAQATATVTVTAFSFTLSASPTSIAAWVGGQFTVQLTLNAAAPAGGITVPLTVTGPGGVITLSAGTVTFAAGANTATYTINANQVSPNSVPNVVIATLPGQFGGGTATTSIIVNLPLTFTPTTLSVGVGQSATVIVTMAAAQAAPTVVTLTYAGTPAGAVTFPATVTIPALTTFATFTVTGVSVTTPTASITGTLPVSLPQGLGGATANMPVTVTP